MSAITVIAIQLALILSPYYIPKFLQENVKICALI